MQPDYRCISRGVRVKFAGVDAVLLSRGIFACVRPLYQASYLYLGILRVSAK